MKKNWGLLILLVLLTVSPSWGQTASAHLKVGLVTDSGTINDSSFNQAAWDGLKRAHDELGADITYLQPTGTYDAAYLAQIGKLYDAGYKVIVLAGFKFETVVYSAQEKYKDAQFILLDGVPNNGRFDATRDQKVGANTVAIFFDEEQAGFVAGVASAVEIQKGRFGIICGMEIPPVQKFNWGFQQGVYFANHHLGTKISINPNHVVYQGTFTDVAAGQILAGIQFDVGVKVIFAIAGGVGFGVFNEAKGRARKGVRVVGVNADQFSQGEYEAGKSVVLTSAIKKLDIAVFAMIESIVAKKFPGGQVLLMDATTNGIGIPETNPNLGQEAIDQANNALMMLSSGDIKLVEGPNFPKVGETE